MIVKAKAKSDQKRETRLNSLLQICHGESPYKHYDAVHEMPRSAHFQVRPGSRSPFALPSSSCSFSFLQFFGTDLGLRFTGILLELRSHTHTYRNILYMRASPPALLCSIRQSAASRISLHQSMPHAVKAWG